MKPAYPEILGSDHQLVFHPFFARGPGGFRDLEAYRLLGSALGNGCTLLTWPKAMTPTTFIFTGSLPRSLLLIATVKSARSRWFSASSRLTRISQACSGFGSRFWPTRRSTFEPGRSARTASKFSVSIIHSAIRHALPKRQADVDQCSLSQDASLPRMAPPHRQCRHDLHPPTLSRAALKVRTEPKVTDAAA